MIKTSIGLGSTSILHFVSLVGIARAPMLDICGSFFPAWMICLTISVASGIALRAILRHRGVETAVGTLAIFYPSLVVLLTCVLWFIFFR